jgi:prophage regulatory protein
MSSALIRKPMVSVQLPENNCGKSVQPERLVLRKLPHTQKSCEADLDRTSNALDDISFLRLPEVKAVTGLSKTSIYELIREKSFPAPVRLGPRAVAWVKSEIKQWAVGRVRASRSAA